MLLPKRSHELARRLHRCGWSVEGLADSFGLDAEEMLDVLRDKPSRARYPARYKRRARALRREGGLSYRSIAYLLGREFGQEPSDRAVINWCKA